MNTDDNQGGHKNNSKNTGDAARLMQRLQTWMVVRLAEELKLNPLEMDPTLPFASYGLDSIVAFALTGELADLLGRELPTTLFWDFPTIQALAFHLAEQSISEAGQLEELARRLAEVESLSGEEIDQ
jgi:acyl carrier protein